MSDSNIPIIGSDQNIIIEPVGDNTIIELDDGTIIKVDSDIIIGLDEGTIVELDESMLVKVENLEDGSSSATDTASDTASTGVQVISTKSAHLRISSTSTQADVPDGPGHSRSRSSIGEMYTFQQKVKKTFKNFPDCTCGLFVHSRDCPRFAMRIRFEKGHVVGVHDGKTAETEEEVKHDEQTEEKEIGEASVVQTQLQAPPGPPNDATFSKIAEDRSRHGSPIPFTKNATLELADGKKVDVEISEGVTQIALKLDGKVVTFRPI